MSLDFDLNIYNYNTEELETFLGLGKNYTSDDIKDKHDNIYFAISKSSYYTDDKKVLEDLKHNDDVQCIIGGNQTDFGEAQNPGLLSYADGVDTMQFLLSL